MITECQYEKLIAAVETLQSVNLDTNAESALISLNLYLDTVELIRENSDLPF